eukprot:gnl/TRDRNA2_/TRDRNA2_30677_c0_seq3.p1 gnl/TRDRNA2_/TRDRNA2_30677_c0~~gnl/TRDRNA2_/TRDRNA2_30677_c0_seq3.p1  ORF type:complete len:317 (-),score=51.17 gnl/TRDRNA2_/TRDRNA2_30677_c0_seq3:15-842(-)
MSSDASAALSGGAEREKKFDNVDVLQAAVDQVFGRDGGSIAGLSFSLTIADPFLEGCPLIGCSTGFMTLCGYEMEEITGRNCRFLVDPVPPELVDNKARLRAREFCEAIKDGVTYRVPEEEQELWMPTGTNGELFCVQMNARKDGSLFRNMFYLRRVDLDDHAYIIGLQAEMPADSDSMMSTCREACKELNKNMTQVEKVLAEKFWYTFPMRRQDHGYQLDDDDDFFSEDSGEHPEEPKEQVDNGPRSRPPTPHPTRNARPWWSCGCFEGLQSSR